MSTNIRIFQMNVTLSFGMIYKIISRRISRRRVRRECGSGGAERVPVLQEPDARGGPGDNGRAGRRRSSFLKRGGGEGEIPRRGHCPFND